MVENILYIVNISAAKNAEYVPKKRVCPACLKIIQLQKLRLSVCRAGNTQYLEILCKFRELTANGYQYWAYC